MTTSIYKVREYLTSLASTVESEWSRIGRRPELFSDAALRALIVAPPTSALSSQSLTDFILYNETLPVQTHWRSDFAEPSVTLHRTDSFAIEVNFWVDSTTAIHDHGFAGAFAVLEGRSIQTAWRFEQRSAPSPDVLLGEFRTDSYKLLLPGETWAILPGRTFIHSLFHISRPSATLVVRTDSGAIRFSERPFLFFPPGLGFDPFAVDQQLQKQIETIDFLRRTSGRHWDAVEGLIERRSLTISGLCRILVHAVESGIAGRVCRQIAVASAQQFAQLDGIIQRVADYLLRQRSLVRLRANVHSENGRLLLALLLLFEEREPIISVLGKMGVTDPAHFLAIETWHLLGQVGASPDRSATGCEIEVLRLFFEGLGEDEVLRSLRNAGSDVSPAVIHEIRELIPGNPLFRSLFTRRDVCSAPQSGPLIAGDTWAT
jgi:hypothetical protein